MTDFDKKTNINNPGLTREDKNRLIAERNQRRRESLRNIKIDSEVSQPAKRAVNPQSTVVRKPTTNREGAITQSTAARGAATGEAKRPVRSYATDITSEAEARRRVARQAEEAKRELANPVRRVRPVEQTAARRPLTEEEAAERRRRMKALEEQKKAQADNTTERKRPLTAEEAAERRKAIKAKAELAKRKARIEGLDDDDEASEDEIKRRFGKSREELSGKKPKKSKVKLYITRALMVLGATLLMVIVALYSFLCVINYGPSKRAHIVFVKSVRETSAIGFLSKWFTTDKELESILKDNGLEKLDDVTNSDLIHIGPTATPTLAPTSAPGEETTVTPVPTEPPIVVGNANNATLASDGRMYENLETDEDGIIIVSLSGSTYKGHMMIIQDPSRVIVGVCNNVNDPGSLGQKLTALMDKYDAVAATNAGGFEDTGGTGTGSVPLGPTFSEGKLIKSGSSSDVMVGFNQDNVLMVGYMNAETAKSYGIRDAVSFGPALIINGQAASSSGVSSGLNPRTAIGQREDGAVLLLVIDGRQASSLGASYADLIDEFKKFGAVNAANLDGGSSSQMYYKGNPVNSRANLIREREMPTAIIVKKK